MDGIGDHHFKQNRPDPCFLLYEESRPKTNKQHQQKPNKPKDTNFK
jgi:hypothetical protein